MKKLFLLPLLALLIGCQPSKITRHWTAKNWQPKQYKQILVLAIATDTDNVLQSKMEDHLTEDLRNMGYYAIAANTIYPSGTFVKGDTNRAIAAIAGRNFDAVFTLVLLDKQKEKFYVPGRITDSLRAGQNSRFEQYMNSVNDRIYTPGYYGEQTRFTWECNFYDGASKQIIYSARTRTFDYASTTILAHTFGQLISYDLIKRKILTKPPAENY